MSKIVIRDPKGDERIHELVDPITTIGRGSANTIQCKDREASRQHCRIEKTDVGYRMVDNRSRNGTILNNQKTEVQDLRPGDVITIGGFKLQFDPPEGAEDEDFAATIEVAPLSEKEAASPRSSGSGGDGKPKYVLEVYEGRQAGQRFELANDTLTIGRNSANTFKIDDESGSSFHAEITKEPTGYFLTDLGSTNGTRVAGEKVVKTRLGPGAEIQIGTTKMRFMNIGAPAEEDEVFGTVVLDTERLERELDEDEVRARAAFVRRIAMGVAAIIVVVGLVFAGKWALNITTAPDVAGIPPGNVLKNWSFGGERGDEGEPDGWRLEAGRYTPWSVKDVDRVSGKLEENAASLVVAREGEARLDEYTQCRAREMVDVQAGKSYRLGGWIKAPDAQGAYGFRVRWLPRRGDERSAIEQAFVTGSQTKWKQKDGVFTPPKWATRAEVSCFAIGNRGSVYFDDVYFAPVDKRVQKNLDIMAGQLSAGFSPSGVFDVMSGTETAVRKAELFFMGQEDAATFHEYADAEDPRSDAGKSVFEGLIPEFASTGHIRYIETVRAGEFGIVAAYELSADSPVALSRAGLRFTVGGAFGYGRMEVFGAEGPLDETSGDIEGAREVVFTVDEDTKLVVSIGEGHKLRIEPRGDEKYMEVTLAGDTTLGRRPARLAVEFNKSSRVAGRAVEELKAKLRAAELAKDFAGMHAACKAIIMLKDRFPKEAGEAEKKLAALDSEADADFENGEGLVERARKAVGATRTAQLLLDELGKMIDALRTKYRSSPYEPKVVDLDVKRTEIEDLIAQRDKDENARKLYVQIPPLIENNPEVALSILVALETRFSGTKPLEKAKAEGLREKIMAKINLAKQRQQALDEIRAKIRNFVQNEEYEMALQVMRSMRAYIKHRDWGPIQELEKELVELARKKKAAEGGGGE
ncbi:MAG: FHA domain-containing protein [Planctomycetota bacterium]|jgi:pSer/pThr/pTyr-binding forkhead associated (FHA) protein